MALMRSSDVPIGAVTVSEAEATQYMWDIVGDWSKTSDVWALRYASGALGSVNAISGYLINSHYRKKLQLGNFGYWASTLPNVLLPGFFTALFHRTFVSSEILLRKENCPVCFELRSAALQSGLGILYPCILSPISNFMLANQYATYRLPELSKDYKQVFNIWQKFTKPLSNTITTLLIVQLVMSSVFTYNEMVNSYKIDKKLKLLEKMLEKDLKDAQ